MFTPLNSHLIQKIEMILNISSWLLSLTAVLTWIWLHAGGLMNDVINYAKHIRIYKKCSAKYAIQVKIKKVQKFSTSSYGSITHGITRNNLLNDKKMLNHFCHICT